MDNISDDDRDTCSIPLPSLLDGIDTLSADDAIVVVLSRYRRIIQDLHRDNMRLYRENKLLRSKLYERY